MKEHTLSVKLPAKSSTEAKQVQQAIERMIQNFQADGIIKMDKLFHSDPFVRNMVKLKLGIK